MSVQTKNITPAGLQTSYLIRHSYSSLGLHSCWPSVSYCLPFPYDLPFLWHGLLPSGEATFPTRSAPQPSPVSPNHLRHALVRQAWAHGIQLHPRASTTTLRGGWIYDRGRSSSERATLLPLSSSGVSPSLVLWAGAPQLTATREQHGR